MEDLQQLRADAPSRIRAAATLDELEEVEAETVGRRSPVAAGRKSLGGLPEAERPARGRLINEVAAELQDVIDQRRAELEREAEAALLEADRVDVTLPGRRPRRGNHNLITSTMDEIVDIFVSLGYTVAVGPEVETSWYNFDALNTPPTHASRLDTDTLYVDFGDEPESVLMRPQTSPMQVRYMQAHPPPVYVVVPGRTFRRDTPDATHSPVFHQVEGLAVDENITMADLRGTLAYFVDEFFGTRVRTRFVPHFFPFTEPSAELHIEFKGEWLELLGCGVVDPNVLLAVDYDPERLSGFAFGIGVERLAMVRHGIADIRHFYGNDLRVLEQFR